MGRYGKDIEAVMNKDLMKKFKAKRGQVPREIAAWMDVSLDTVYRFLKKHGGYAVKTEGRKTWYSIA